MIRKLIILICLTLTVAALRGQSTWPPAYELKRDKGPSIELPDTYWQMYADRDGLDVEQAESPAISARFHANTTVTQPIDFDIATYWQRYRLKNPFDHDVAITIAEGRTDAVVYYMTDDKHWQRQHTGGNVPWSQRDGFKKINHVPITIPAGSTVKIYERNTFDYSLVQPQRLIVTINFADDVLRSVYLMNEREDFSDKLSSFVIGLLFFAAMLNLFFYRAVREKVYLFYGLTLLAVALRSQATPLFAWYREHPVLYNYLSVSLFIFQFFFLVQTIRFAVGLRARLPRWGRVVSTLNILGALSYALAQIVLSLVMPAWVAPVMVINRVLGLLLMVTLLITLLMFVRKKEPDPRAFSASILPLAAWVTLGYLVGLPGTRWASDWYASAEGVVTAICSAWLLSLFTATLIRRFSRLRQENARKEIEKERLARQQEAERNALIARQKIELEEQVEARTAELNRSIEELKSTQSQLIQSEKMASLGELTAGIAHEIQNPLNFVNNFAEVSTELVAEMTEELENGDKTEAIAIAGDIKQNLEKIRHHGQRADSIVKGMLQHSRAGAGTKEVVDLNALTDEYLRLSYHGIRAKDKSFNVLLKTDFAADLPKISAMPQELGRVLLNLFNNAFYSLAKKKAAGAGTFEPLLAVTTSLDDAHVRITVRDNGIGIPEAVVNKIYQPFFTTKPTGEGTGLGLSLSYDIVTKVHGGELHVTTREGEFAQFDIILPRS